MPGWSDHQSATLGTHSPPCRISRSPLVFLVGALLITAPAFAEWRVVTAQGEYRMGERDTREDAVRLATESAKRSALEQVATYLESVTVVDGMDVTRDEIRTYTAGLVLVLDQKTQTRLEGEIIVVTVDLVAHIDTEEVRQAIAALRENEDARVQLAALRQENEQLQQDLDAANRALANASTTDQVQQAAQQRQEILNRVQSNTMVSQAWTEWVLVAPVVYAYPGLGPAQTLALLNAARGLYPASPHIVVAERVFSSKQPPALQPPMPSATGGTPGRLPRHEMIPSAGSPGVPRSLNEITHTAPSGPPRMGGRPQTPDGRGSRTLTDVRQLNPFLPPAAGPPSSRSLSRMQRFLQQNGSPAEVPGAGFRPPSSGGTPREIPGGQLPRTRGLPPGEHRFRSPQPHQVPQTQFQNVPRSFGGGGRFGGGGGPGGGGAVGGGVGGRRGGGRGR